MIVNFEDKDFQFDLDEIDVTQATYIQNHTGLTLSGLWQGFRESDPKALRALYWLMQNQNGVTMDINKVNFKALKFDKALTDAMVAEVEATDPTGESPAAETVPETN